LLMLDNTLARNTFGIKPVWSIDSTVQKTISWYADFLKGYSPLDLCERDIKSFIADVIYSH